MAFLGRRSPVDFQVLLHRCNGLAFDKLECGGGLLLQALLLAYKSGFQVWDVEHVYDVR
ncbi:hypothetical protein ZEAMMB73_Zm00001d018604 [Zea mays]|uniref:Uncharacterized protein n=1 Tax=Zea mays TaxID=4577 RepID=A0A1D6HQL3_MAIZE|nr:hypothetical protein ZEAMMB73_Zm00001d018604 [Zea mays]